MFSLELPHQGDSDEYTPHTVINIKEKIPNYPKYNNVYSYGMFSQGLKKKFETAVVNEPSVFKPLKFYRLLLLTMENTAFDHLCHFESRAS